MSKKIDRNVIEPYFNIYGQFKCRLSDGIDRVVVSFGPNVDQNPSPSDPLVNKEHFMELRTRFSVMSNPSFKFMYATKIHAAWSTLSANGHKLFHRNSYSDMCSCISQVAGRFWSVNSGKPSCLIIAIDDSVFDDSDNFSIRYPVSIRQVVFDSEDEMLNQDSSAGETFMLARFSRLDTAYKYIARIFSHFNGQDIFYGRSVLNIEKVLELFPVFFDDQRKVSSVPVHSQDRELVSV